MRVASTSVWPLPPWDSGHVVCLVATVSDQAFLGDSSQKVSLPLISETVVGASLWV